jgi:ABC-type nickel/cobalt efflux system permease component RcnA
LPIETPDSEDLLFNKRCPVTDPGLLYLLAVKIGLIHTLVGPDHYVPFVAMSRIGGWSLRKTVWVTALCGVGHVLSSVAIGALGILVGLAVFDLKSIEAVRGEVAGWLLLTFGLTYFAWGVLRAIRNKPHSHIHAHEDGTVHSHAHTHTDAHLHAHEPADAGRPVRGQSLTPWVLFTIFLFGPCEPLIPMLMLPAAANASAGHVIAVALVFLLTTIVTMTTLVVAGSLGFEKLRWPSLERYGHALAGMLVLACGVAVKVGL